MRLQCGMEMVGMLGPCHALPGHSHHLEQGSVCKQLWGSMTGATTPHAHMQHARMCCVYRCGASLVFVKGMMNGRCQGEMKAAEHKAGDRGT